MAGTIWALLALAAVAAPDGDCRPRIGEAPTSQVCLLSLGDLAAGFIPGLLADYSLNVEQFVATLGPPSSFETSPPFEEHFSGLECRTVTVTYPKLSVKAIFETSRSMREARLERLSIEDPESKLPCGLALGMSFERFVEALGPPSKEQRPGGAPNYMWEKSVCHDGVWNVWSGDISLHLVDGGVEGITWNYWSD